MAGYCYWADAVEAARDHAGNWRRFTSFGWHERPDDEDNWAIVYTHNRDSDLLAQSNALAIRRIMAPHLEGDAPDAYSERHGHWACGWVDGYSIRCLDASGQPTAAWQAWCEIQESLEHYPSLDDERLSELESEATYANVAEAGRRFVRDGAPDDWADRVYSWLSENNERALYPRDGFGGYPSDDDVCEALEALGLLDDEG
jgi:hypothetical protein